MISRTWLHAVSKGASANCLQCIAQQEADMDIAKTASASLFGLIFALGIGGCGGDEAPVTCSLDARLSGAVEWQSSSAGDPACLIPFGGGSTVDMSFRPLEGDILRFDLSIKDLKEGQTGTFTGSVEIELRDRRIFRTAATACSFRVDEQVFSKDDQFRKQYLSAGSGECSTAAMLSSGSGTLNIAPFIFRSPTNY